MQTSRKLYRPNNNPNSSSNGCALPFFDDDLSSPPVGPMDRYSLRSYPVFPSPRQQRGLPDKITPLEFEHHDRWRNTLEKLSVLGLNIHNGLRGEMFGFEEWLFKTLWSLFGALPGIQRTRNPDGTERYDSTPEFLEQLRSGSSLVALPAGPMIVVYVEKGREFGAEKWFKKARRIVETVIPTGRFKYVDTVEVMETPFLERKRITPAWVSSKENDLNTELYKDTLDKYLEHRDLTLL
ncbi:hypothetical protein V8F06_012701 [Rhypophila decipiens]